MSTPLGIGIIGMGGFAGSHHATVAKLEERGLVRLICTCDPDPGAFASAQRDWRFAERGVRVFPNYQAMLEACHRDLAAVIVPTPLYLHGEMHAAIAACGLPAYLEKPPTLDYAELERMIAADARLRRASVVGFNFIIEKTRLALKGRLLAGEFGAVRGGTLSAAWPRPAKYFGRNAWAGRLMHEGRIVLDSCFGNAMAHFVHNLLFWTGTPGLFSWADIAAVRAELYRAHAIEGADTFFVEADLTSGTTLRFALTHVCAGASIHTETVICDRAVLRYVVGGAVEITWTDGRVERLATEAFDGLVENHLEYYRYLRGEVERPVTTLADARPFVALNDLAHISSGQITPIPSALVTVVRDDKDQMDYLSVADLPRLIDAFLTRGIWPGSQGWGREPGEVVTPADLGRFHETVKAMVAARSMPG